MQPTTIEQISHRIGAWRPEDIPDAALDQAAWCVLDLLGAAMAGWEQGSARAMTRWPNFTDRPACARTAPRRRPCCNRS